MGGVRGVLASQEKYSISAFIMMKVARLSLIKCPSYFNETTILMWASLDYFYSTCTFEQEKRLNNNWSMQSPLVMYLPFSIHRKKAEPKCLPTRYNNISCKLARQLRHPMQATMHKMMRQTQREPILLQFTCIQERGCLA